jgi:long-chain acyl-CoA synthetase
MNLAHIIDEHADEAIALFSRGRPTTYGELREQVAAVRGGLADLGIESGDRVALVLGNSRHFVVSYLAVVGLGAIAVPLNPASPAPELTVEIAGVDAVAVIVERATKGSWSDVDRTDLAALRHVVVTDPAEPTGDAAAQAGVVAFDDLLAATPRATAEVEPSTVAVLVYTSGTAGAPRAAMLTHGNLLANIDQSRSADGHVDEGDVIYGVLPLFHIFGLNVTVGFGLSVGATLVLVQRFDPATAAQSIRDRGVTVIPGAPALWAAFAHFDELPDDAFATVRLALSGASRLPVSVAEAMRDRFGVTLREGYGLTEASPVVTTSTGITPRFGSVGRALHGVEVRLVNVNGDALVGDVGEILVRGPNVFVGYYRDPEATAVVLDDDGWLHTGDMATVDDDGYLYLVDRSKDLIIVSGFNVYPAEVEAVLVDHPDVVEAAVVGVPHPHTGEAVKAFVVTTPDSRLDEDELIEHTLDHLARYKCPTKVIFVEALPRNATGKVMRRGLDDALRSGAHRSTAT